MIHHIDMNGRHGDRLCFRNFALYLYGGVRIVCLVNHVMEKQKD
jgi:hypothetical protein